MPDSLEVRAEMSNVGHAAHVPRNVQAPWLTERATGHRYAEPNEPGRSGAGAE